MAGDNYIASLSGAIVVAVGKRGGGATNVRTIDGEAICTTAYSYKLDEDMGRQGWKAYEGREAIAYRIALMWNACRHLSDQQLAQLALEGFSHPLPTQEAR